MVANTVLVPSEGKPKIGFKVVHPKDVALKVGEIVVVELYAFATTAQDNRAIATNMSSKINKERKCVYVSVLEDKLISNKMEL